jgi:membrane protein DedA with SNARE-associated domain
MRKWIIRLIILIYIVYLLYSNDKIARQEGSSLVEQILYILAAIGVFFIITKIIKKKD